MPPKKESGSPSKARSSRSRTPRGSSKKAASTDDAASLRKQRSSSRTPSKRSRAAAQEIVEGSSSSGLAVEIPSTPVTPRGSGIHATSGPRTPTQQRKADVTKPTPKTPAHMRSTSSITKGFKFFRNPADCLETLREWNNQTANVYIALFGAALFLALNVSIGLSASNLGPTFAGVRHTYHVAILLAIVDCVLMALYHLFCPLPQSFSFWSAVNLARPTVSFAALALVMKLGSHCALSVPMAPGLLSQDGSLQSLYWIATLWFLAFVAVYVFAHQHSGGHQSGAGFLRFLVVLAGLIIFGVFASCRTAQSARAIAATVFFLSALVVEYWKIPESIVPRVFDYVGNSFNLANVLHILSVYCALSDFVLLDAGGATKLKLVDSWLWC